MKADAALPIAGIKHQKIGLGQGIPRLAKFHRMAPLSVVENFCLAKSTPCPQRRQT